MPVTIPTTQERIILGIDPGTTIMGYGVLRIVGNNPQLMTMGVLQLGKMGDHYLKLKRIFERVLGLIEQYHPDEMAIEAPFFGKNVQSMLKLGRAQGIAMAAALYRDIPITEYAPLKIKMAITGNGNAAKNKSPICYGASCISRKKTCYPNSMQPTDWPLPCATSTRPTALLVKRPIRAGKILSTNIRPE